MHGKIGQFVEKIIKSTSVWYIASSVLAFVIEYVITLWLGSLLLASLSLGKILSNDIAMSVAWICSSHVNFCVNRTLVFRSKSPALPAYLKYFALALPVFLIKSFGLVNMLLGLTRLPMWFVYPVAQAAMFVITYIVQKRYIFMKKKESGDSDEANN